MPKLIAGQAWSIDAIVGVFLFIIIVISVIAFSFSRGQDARSGELEVDGERIYSSLSNKDTGPVLDQRKVNPDELVDLSKLSYQELKARMGISSDFCIYLVDENGNLEYINGSNIDSDGTIVGLGSPKVTINGVRCG